MQLHEFMTGRAGIKALVILGAALTGCAETPTLQPAPGAHMVPDDGAAARSTVAGVTVTATAGGWDGNVDIARVLVPLEVKIENESDRKLRIRYSDFALVTESGDRYAALPPYQVEGAVTEPLAAAGYGPIDRPGFTYRGFNIAVHYGHIYDTLPHDTLQDLYYDPNYYAYYFPYWRNARLRVQLPTPEMLRMAVPEGVLDEAGQLEGYIYFEKIPEQARGTRVSFHLDLIDAISGDRFATLHIPFVATDRQQ